MPFSQSRTARCENRVGVSLAAIAAATAVLFGASAAGAEPSLQEQRRQAELILAQVQELDAEVGAAAERFNGANYTLGRLTERLQRARTDLRRTRKELGTARGRASERLVQLYVNGSGPSTLELMLGSTSLSDMIDQLEAGRRILEQNTKIARDLNELARRTKQRERQLAASRATQADLVGRLESERNAIATKLRERRRLLSSVQAEVERLEAEDRARQVELRRRAVAELARQRALAAVQRERTAEAPDPQNGAAAAGTTPDPIAEPPAAPDVTPAPAPPADASRGAQVVAIAMRYLGVPYKWGGASPETGFDCSGFTLYVVTISSLSEPYRVANWVGARRVL